ncbi:hypothetical protein EP7_001428 [Isosphaeraceae bacterium EP7]
MAKKPTAATTAAGKKATVKKAAAKKPAKTAPTRPVPAASRNLAAQPNGTVFGSAAVVAPGSPEEYRARVRMYRHGLGDCFLVTFPRTGHVPFQMLIDCGALARDAEHMQRLVQHVCDTVRADARDAPGVKARLDVVVATHEHKDHVSGFNQARELFDNEFKFGAVWLGWTENLTQPQIKELKEARKQAATKLRAALGSPLAAAAGDAFNGLEALLGFVEDDQATGARSVAEAIEYLKHRGEDAGDLRYLEPGTGPIEMDGVTDVRAYVLGPPRDPILLKGSEVTEQLKRDGVIYHLAATGKAGLDALGAALTAADPVGDRYHPFSAEHRIARTVPEPANDGKQKPNPYFAALRPFVKKTYERKGEEWRRIDHDWLGAFGQLALDLDSDTNNTSLVLAFEFVKTREVLLFVGDAQVGNWRSWANVEFAVPGIPKPLPAHDLIRRTVFYKVGHHCSHNATIKAGGLELMTRDDELVAFIPLDRETAAQMGKKDPVTLKPKGWDMPAAPLFKALREKAKNRVVISDPSEPLTPEAMEASIISTDTYVDYFLR